MKQAIYKGVTYNVPLWTRWLAEDEDGELYAYSVKPTLDSGQYWYCPGQTVKSALIATFSCDERIVEVE